MFKKYPQPLNCEEVTLLETNVETQKGPYKDYSPSKRGAIWVSMLVWGSVGLWVTFGLETWSKQDISSHLSQCLMKQTQGGCFPLSHTQIQVSDVNYVHKKTGGRRKRRKLTLLEQAGA